MSDNENPQDVPEQQNEGQQVDASNQDTEAAQQHAEGGVTDGGAAHQAGGDGAAASDADPSKAAAAIAARLVQQHEGGQADGGNNKRPREDDETAAELEGPEKRHASAGMINLGANESGEQATNQNQEGDDPPVPEPFNEDVEIPAEMVGKIIGKAGETIRNLQATTQTRIQVDHSGEGPNKTVKIAAYSRETLEAAKSAINSLVHAEEVDRIVECPKDMVGRIIGRGGETIRALQSHSQARVSVNQDFPDEVPRQVIINGSAEAVELAATMVTELIQGEPGSAHAVIQRVCARKGIGKSHVLTAPKSLIGRIIGRGGEVIKNIQKTTGASVQIDQTVDPCKITIGGQTAAVDHAKVVVEDIMNGQDPNIALGIGGGMGGGAYGGYGGMQQGGYGGMQQGGYGAGYGGGMQQQGGYGGGYGGYGAGYGGGMQQQGGYAGGYGADQYAAATGYAGQYAAAPYGGPQAAAGGTWQELFDDQGRPYYYNSATGVTQWEKPSDFGA